MIKRFMVIAICVSLARIMAIPANAAYVNDPTCICSIPADRECEYTNAELNMFANTVNGEVGGLNMAKAVADLYESFYKEVEG